MGVYHFAGLGKSIGAVTAAFSYLSALKAAGGPAAERMFARAGSAGEDEAERGSVQAIILFTTEEIAGDEALCDDFILNRPGFTDTGPEKSGRPTRSALETHLRTELEGIAWPGRPVELYWCLYDRHRPVETFERVARIMRAVKRPGKVGHEIWVNLTGGSNIVNGALQLAASLTGTPARLFYLITDDPRCLRHTRPPGDGKNPFWVDLPLVFLDFSGVRRLIVEEMTTMADEWIDFDELRGRLLSLGNKKLSAAAQDEAVLKHTVLRPLSAQQFVIRDGNRYQIGPAWERLARYWRVIEQIDASETSLSTLRVPWLERDVLEF